MKERKRGGWRKRISEEWKYLYNKPIISEIIRNQQWRWVRWFRLIAKIEHEWPTKQMLSGGVIGRRDRIRPVLHSKAGYEVDKNLKLEQFKPNIRRNVCNQTMYLKLWSYTITTSYYLMYEFTLIIKVNSCELNFIRPLMFWILFLHKYPCVRNNSQNPLIWINRFFHFLN